MKARTLACAIAIVMITGCVGISSGKYPGLESSKSYVDCGAMASQPRAGIMSQISGLGNFVRLAEGQDNLAVCFGDMHSNSTYIVGPIIPIIPMFGLDGRDEQPPIHIWLFNQGESDIALSFRGVELQRCQLLNGFVTEQCTIENEQTRVNAGDVAVLKANYSDVLSLSIQTNNQNSYHLTAKQSKGTFFIFSG